MRYFFLLFCLILVSCDPTYSIEIRNDSNKTIIVESIVNSKFQPKDLNIEKEEVTGLVRFSIEPGEFFYCGLATREIENDLPFESIKIFTDSDTIVGSNPEEILKLLNGNTITPYHIIVK